MELDTLMVRIEADAKPLQNALGTVGKQADSTLSTIASFGDRLGTSLARAAVNGANLSGILRSVARDIANVALQQTVINPTGNLLGSLVSSLFGRAGGGSVSANTPYVVGERGPELFVPSSSGRVESNGADGSSASPVSVSVNVDARGADATTAAQLRSAAAEIESRTFAAVFAAMERGGRYARISGRR